MKALYAFIVTVLLFVILIFVSAPTRDANIACREAGGTVWPSGCFVKFDPATGKAEK